MLQHEASTDHHRVPAPRLSRRFFITAITSMVLAASLPPKLARAKPNADGFGLRRLSPAALRIEGIDVTLGSTSASADHGLEVYADTIRIEPGLPRLPGQSVVLFAREIWSAPGAAIDASGADADASRSPRATDGTVASEHGHAGRTGDSGGDGGSITIYSDQPVNSTPSDMPVGKLRLLTNGGNAGAGQDGGNGAPGVNGANGPDGSCDNNNEHAGAQGGNAIAGGVGGDGGSGGRAGSAGAINLRYTRGGGRSADYFQNRGRGAAGGAAGAGGAAAKGGIGGYDSRVFEHTGTGRERESSYRCHVRGGGKEPDGHDAPAGPGGVHGAASGDGGWLPFTNKLQPDEVAAAASVTQLATLLHWSELQYYNVKVSVASKSLTWIRTLAAINGAQPNVGGVESSEWKALAQRAGTLLSQMHAGLDVYGMRKDYVPLLDQAVFTNSINALFQSASLLEQSGDKYDPEAADQASQRVYVQGAVKQLDSQANDALAQVTQLNNESNKKQDVIAQLTQHLTTLQARVDASTSQFQNAVASQGRGCTFQDTVRTLSLLVAVAGPTYLAADELISTLNAPEAGAAFDSVKGTIKLVQTVGGDVKTIGTSVAKLGSLAAADNAKLLITLDDFNKVLAPYLNLAEAVALKELLTEYVQTIVTLNNAKLDYTALVLQISQLKSKAAALQAQSVRLQTELAGNFDPTLPSAQAVMSTALNDAKGAILRYMHLKARAIEYTSVADQKVSVTPIDRVSALAKANAELTVAETDALQMRGGANSPFVGATVVIKANPSDAGSDRDPFLTFRNTGRLLFTIPTSHHSFSSYKLATVSGVEISVDGLSTTDGSIVYRLTHLGDASVVNAANQTRSFTHQPRNSELKYANGKLLTPAPNLGGQQGVFAYLSPFATWLLSVDDSENIKPTRSLVSSITLTFSGQFMP
jgi:hypothetical protein